MNFVQEKEQEILIFFSHSTLIIQGKKAQYGTDIKAPQFCRASFHFAGDVSCR